MSASVFATMPEGVEKLSSVEGITEYRVANGLHVLPFPDPSKETATVNITYLVGSRHEGYGETGMAHLLEHMVFKGTPKHTDIPKELTAHGCRPKSPRENNCDKLALTVQCLGRDAAGSNSVEVPDARKLVE